MSLFQPNLIKTNFVAETKADALMTIAQDFQRAGVIEETQDFYQKLLEREEKLSTGIGHGVAIPHLRDASVSQLQIGIYLLDNEIEFDSLDRKKVKLIVCFAIPSNEGNQYMKILQKMSEFLRNESNRSVVYNCKDADELLRIFRSVEI
ncbi:MAG: PTS sugar transporter subunit IIA [Candidatus Cloacimonetes bacterium]|nr:PTS sugar transporter subunit IIA [Candidatus Cloacimonadota bacterium]